MTKIFITKRIYGNMKNFILFLFNILFYFQKQNNFKRCSFHFLPIAPHYFHRKIPATNGRFLTEILLNIKREMRKFFPLCSRNYIETDYGKLWSLSKQIIYLRYTKFLQN